MRKCSIADALFSNTQQKLLSALLLNSRERAYASELSKRFGVKPSTLQRDLARLTSAGILKMTRNGNRTYYQADEECPVFPELRSLLIKTAGVVDTLRAQLAPIASRINLAAVYGSIASGVETSRSDIDLLLIGSVKMIDLSPLLEQATSNLGRQINPSLYTSKEFSQKAHHSHFVKSLLAKTLLFVLGSKSDLETIAERKPRRVGTHEPG